MAADDEQSYEGVVKKLLQTQYVIECEEVMEWYGVNARMSAKMKPHGVDIGGAITFGLKETSSGKPLVAWAKASAQSAKRKGKDDDEDRFTGVVAQRGVKDPSLYLVDCEEVKEWYSVSAKMSVNEKPDDVDVGDTITFSIEENEGGYPRAVQVQKGTGPWRGAGAGQKQARTEATIHGQVRFNDVASAEAGLKLHGRRIEGLSIRVEKDHRDPTRLRIFGLPVGCPWQKLKDLFQEAGVVAHAQVFDDRKGKGKGDSASGRSDSGGSSGR